MDRNAIISASVRDLAEQVKNGELSAHDVLTAHQAQIALHEPRVRAFFHLASDTARQGAMRIDDRRRSGAPLGALAGVPFGLKDLFVTRNIPTTAGSRILAGWVPPYQGAHAQRLAAADGVMVGKLSMDEFAMGSTNENTPTVAVCNPWDPTRVAGGSSGGSAAAVAARMVSFALGSDTGGSIRQPASHCGVVGLKPTYGRVSRFGMVAFASSLDQAGPITRNVRDAARVLGVIAGGDERDATSLWAGVPDYLAACERGIKGLRVGVHRHALDLPGLDPQVRAAFEASLAQLQGLGAQLVDVDLPHFDVAIATYYVLCAAEAASNLARYDGIRYGARITRDTLVETYEASRSQGFGAEVKRRILLGTFVLRKDSYANYYGRAQRVRNLIARDYAQAFERCDVIASPTAPTPAAKLGELTQDPLAMYLSDVFTIGANLAGLPAISLPCGFAHEGTGAPPLPIGLQLIGPHLGEEVVFAAAAAYEDQTPWHLRSPSTADDTVGTP